MPKTIAVFFGGRSNEREISVITGMLAVNLLRSAFRVIPVYLSPEGGMTTGEYRSPADFRKQSKTVHIPIRLEGKKVVRIKRNKPLCTLDCALNCCHGGAGEDGTMSAILSYNGIPSASPGIPMSAIFMDKILTKLAARGLGVPTVRSFFVRERAWEEGRADVLAEAERFGYPLVVKPARLGSSIGIKVAKDAEELAAALDLAFRLDTAALIEAYLAHKRDINCAAYRRGGEIVLSPTEEVFSDEEILTFSEKYERTQGRTSRLPAEIPEETAARIRGYTERIYEAFEGNGVVRADFLISEGEVFFNELNTVPGSLSCYLFGGSLSESREFLISLIHEALSAPLAEKEVLETGVLEQNLFLGKRRK